MTVRVRRSLTALQDDYEKGDKKPLEDLMRAWKGIKELPADDPRSFFKLGGYHGEPFRGAGWGVGSNVFWGGYCHHGNVLFPVWHRVYCLQVEDALRTIEGCDDVTLPFWDECGAKSLKEGIPWALTRETFDLDGKTIPNPLRSFTFPVNVVDHVGGDDPNYSKPKGYETVRYPYSGLVGTPADVAKTKKHNEQWTYAEAVRLLDKNIVAWLNQKIVIKGRTVSTGVHAAFVQCLQAPNYTVFSNTTSMQEHNDNAAAPVVALESPHNKIHLAVGGYDVPTGPNAGDDSVIPGANGDMGENDTAGLDPIFFFHHCFIDRVFWLWQVKHGFTDDLPIIDGYPGTNSADGQGATPGIAPNTWLTMDTALQPFVKDDEGGRTRPYTGRDAVDIKALGYEYDKGSLEDDEHAELAAAVAEPDDAPKLHVSGVDRGRIRGSFLITAIADVEGEEQVIGTEAVLSRWHVEGCANCQTHLQAGATFPLHGLGKEIDESALHVEVRTRDGLLGGRTHALAATAQDEPRPFHVELR